MSVVVLLSMPNPFVEGDWNIFQQALAHKKNTTLSPGLNNYTAALTADHHNDDIVSLPEKPPLT